MPRPRFDKLDPEIRRRVLEAAAREFATRGFETASLNRVIEAAGISKGSFYYYFDDKADLFATVVRMAWEVCQPSVPLDPSDLDAGTFWPALRGWLEEFSAATREKAWLAGIARLIYHPPADAHVERLVEEEFERVGRFLRRLIRRGQELAVVRTDLPADLLLRLVLAVGEAGDRWMVDHGEGLDPTEADRLMGRLFEILRELASPGPPDDAAARAPADGTER
jgi:AcrR family transcriptional regulator